MSATDRCHSGSAESSYPKNYQPKPSQEFSVIQILKALKQSKQSSISSIMTEQHFVMLPFMAQGHLIPFLALAKLITHRHPSVTITLATTPLNIGNLSPLLPPNSPIHLHPLPFTATDHNLPAGTENTDSLSFPTILNFYPASESLRPHFDLLLDHLSPPPTAIIADVFTGWSVESAASRNIFHATFTTCSGYGTTVYFSVHLHHPHSSGAAEFPLPGFPPTLKLHRSQLSNYLRHSSGTEPWCLFFKRQISLSLRSSAMICNTVEEVETEGLRLLRIVAGGDLPVFPVGPLLPLGPGLGAGGARAGKQPEIALTNCIEWLDAQLPTSVVYVCFGSQNTMGTTQMAALAAGLEGSGSPFIWVVRPPLGSDVKGEVWLPEGFEERVGKRGLVVRGWAPQLEILSHPATGVFVSHCGWNSMLESLSRGVPLVGWPLASEQFYNSKMMEEEMGVGVEVARGFDAEVEGKEVERVIRIVVGEEGKGKGKGKGMRERARLLKEMIMAAMREDGAEVGSSLRAVDEFIERVVMESASRAVRQLEG